MKRIGVIGCGTMGAAILRGLLKAGVVRSSSLLGYDANRSQLKSLQSLRIKATSSAAALVDHCSVIIIAVKPQQMRQLLQEIASHVTHRHLIISIAAGISTSSIEKWLGRGIRVVRVMPNTPAQIGQGVSVVCRGRFASAGDGRMAMRIFRALGEVLELPEKLFHAVTAISGSGPAYLFYLMEAMLEAGQRLKIPPPALEKLVRQTVAGSAALALQSAMAPETLRQRVTSKGGTTEAAIRTFDRRRVRSSVVAGIEAAARRSKELGV